MVCPESVAVHAARTRLVPQKRGWDVIGVGNVFSGVVV